MADKPKSVRTDHGPGPNTITAAVPIDGYDVVSWSPDPEPGRTPPTQLWVIYELAIEDAPALVLRLKSDRAADEFIGILREHRAAIWGDGASCPVYSRPCPEHDHVHGAEAEELRTAIESLIEEVRAGVRVSAAQLQALLDNIDARDSLAYIEAKKASEVQE